MKLNVRALKVIMREKQETITSLSIKIYVHRTTLSAWLNGRIDRLSLENIYRIISVLGMNNEQIIKVFFFDESKSKTL